MATVQLQQVRKSFGSTEILRGIDLTIHDQQLTVFVGPSGCGKSTLLRLIAGLEDITSGDLFLDGLRVNDLPPAKRGLALVFQSYALYPHMSVADNMSFSLKLAGVPRPQRLEKVAEAARILNLETLLDRKPKELSGGQRQRVAIGRAIVRNPRVFLFDEPLSNLDAALRVRTRLELSKLHRQLRATMIYVTHDQVEAMTMADRIVVMQAGIIEQVGSPMELYRSPKNLFVAGFIGSPRMNFLPAIVDQVTPTGLAVSVNQALTLHLSVHPGSAKTGDRITIGIRPEHILLVESGGLSAQVQTVEHLGSESFLHLALESGESVTARVLGETSHVPDEMLHLAADPAFVHVFDSSGIALEKFSAPH